MKKAIIEVGRANVIATIDPKKMIEVGWANVIATIDVKND